MRLPTFLIVTAITCIHLAGTGSNLLAQNNFIDDSEVRRANFESDAEFEGDNSELGPALSSTDSIVEKQLDLETESANLFGQSPDTAPELENLRESSSSAQWRVVLGTLQALGTVGLIGVVFIGIVIHRKRTHQMRLRRGY